MTGRIHSFETFGAADGPGVRFVVFLAGCPLRCAYCHNPDTWARPPALEMSAEDVLKRALRYRSYWGEKGGITVSGGEPLLQPEWLATFERLMAVTDLVLLDIKAFDRALHEELTGRPNDNILDCARYLNEIGKDVWIRHVLVPGVTERDGDTEKIAAFLKPLANIRRIEVLPYHTLGLAKWQSLGLPNRLAQVNPPTPQDLAQVRKILSGA